MPQKKKGTALDTLREKLALELADLRERAARVPKQVAEVRLVLEEDPRGLVTFLVQTEGSTIPISIMVPSLLDQSLEDALADTLRDRVKNIVELLVDQRARSPRPGTEDEPPDGHGADWPREG